MSPSARRQGAVPVVIAALAAAALAAPAAAREVPFTAAQPLAGSFVGARALAFADLDRDGDTDAVAGAATDGLAWWENAAGDGSAWIEHAIDAAFTGAFDLAVGDLDGDGWPDVAAVSRGAGDVAWWENDGTPATGAWTRFSIDTAFAQANSLALADLDGNGTLDVVASGEAADEVAWWENDGSPLDDTTDLGGGDFWVGRTIAALDAPVAVAVGDLDGDGALDVAAAGAPSAADSAIAWARNDGTPGDGGWTARLLDDVFASPRSLELADLDGDGELDVLAGSDGLGDMVMWWESDGSPLDDTADLGNGNRWPQHAIATGANGVTSVQAVDLDGDGDIDVLAALATDDHLTWFENQGDPTAVPWLFHQVDDAVDGARAARAADLDGDGDLDLAAAAFAADAAGWWENRTIHRSAHYDLSVTLGAGDQPQGLALADVDGDGDLDVVSGQDSALAHLSWWENDGTPEVAGWSEHAVGTPFTPPLTVAAGDLDGDGDADVVAGEFVSATPFSWWENDGTPAAGAWSEHSLRASADSIRAAVLADLDRDGDLDVVFAEGFGDRVGWFENDGTACAPACAWPEHAVDAAFGLPAQLAVADLDGDGDLDVASQSGADQTLGDAVRWWPDGGGQLALAGEDRSSGGLLEGAADDVLAIAATHRGRAGDSAAELAALTLLFEETAGDPLTTAEANALVDRLELVLDDGDGVFDGGDTTVVSLPDLALLAGEQTVGLPDDATSELAPGETRTWFVALTAAAGGAAATPGSFRVAHLASAAGARDADAVSPPAVPLSIERAADLATGTISVEAGCFFLGLSHTGGGSAPAPGPDRSVGCAAGHYVPGEVVTLTATPDPGWFVSLWQGTDDDLSLATVNTVTMPAADHAASVHYAFPDELVIDGDFLAGAQEREACLAIRAGDADASGDDTTVAAGADVTFRAGERVVFHDGFVVREFASFRAEIASPAECAP